MLVERQIVHKRDLPNFRQAEWAFNKHWKKWVVDLETVFYLRKRLRGESKRVVSPGTLSRLEKATEVVSLGTLSEAKSGKVVSPGTPSLVSPGTPSVVSPGTPTIDRLTIDRLTIPSPSLGAGEFQVFFEKLKGWTGWDEDDEEWLAKIRTKFPEFNIEIVGRCKDYYSGRTVPKNKGTWKNRINQWCEHSRQFAKEKAERGKNNHRPTGRTRSTYPGKVPTAEELAEQKRRYRL